MVGSNETGAAKRLATILIALKHQGVRGHAKTMHSIGIIDLDRFDADVPVFIQGKEPSSSVLAVRGQPKMTLLRVPC